MIITICFLYSVLCVLSVLGFLFISLEIHELLFWCYELIPLGISLIPAVKPFFNFLIAWIKFMWNICEVFFYIAFHLFSYVFALVTIGIPFLIKPVKLSCSFCKWMYSELWRGIFWRGNPILNIFSWIFVTCTFFLCFDCVFHRRELNLQNQHDRDRNDQQNGDEDHDDQENENIENRLIEIRRRLLNRTNNNLQGNRNREPTNNGTERPDNTDNENSDDNIHPNQDQYDIDRQLCIICIENVRNFAVFPCGHLHFCRSCVLNLFRSRQNVKCPVCNGHIQEYRRVYV